MGRIAIAGLQEILALRQPPNHWRGGRTREVIIDQPMKLCSFEGWVTVELIHARTGLVKQHLHFKNLITTAALNAFGANNQLANFLRNGWLGVGTGNTAPANGDTGLQTPTGVRTNSEGGGASSTGWGTSNAYVFRRTVREFSESQSNGNLTEFGMFNASSAGIMLCRQLFKDGAGSATVVTKTSDDKLRVTYEFRMYPSTVDITGTVTVNAVNYDYTGRVCNMGVDTAWGDQSSGAVGMLNNFGRTGNNTAVGNASNATSLGSTSSSGVQGATQSGNNDSSNFTAYVADSFYMEYAYIWNVGTANLTPGIRGFNFQPWSSANSTTHQLFLSAAIPKTNTQKLTLTFRWAWARH